MKKFLTALLLGLVLLLPLAACDRKTPQGGGQDQTQTDNNGQDQTQTDKAEITGVTFSDRRVEYDGEEHSVTVTGTLPDGVSVQYANNTGTDADTYEATATLSGEGYRTLTLHATLTINPMVITGVTFENKRVVYTGKEYAIEITDTLPASVSVQYTDNVGTNAGTYHAAAVLTGKNYETLTLYADLEIYTVQEIVIKAKDVLGEILDRPDPWSFLPVGLSKETMAYDTLPQYDFTNFVHTASISERFIGKQLNVLYEALDDAETALSYFDKVYAASETIASVYQTFLNGNPANYKEFEGETAGFKIRIVLNDMTYTLFAGNSVVSVELISDVQTDKRYGRIQITNGVALKYETAANRMKLAVKGTVNDVGFLRQIEFIRDNADKVTGYLNEFIGAENVAIKTSAVLYVDESRTVIMSNKRETDDLPILGYEEIYSSQTGIMIGGEVTESLKLGKFDTLWFPMSKVTGITSVKAVKKHDAETEDASTVNLDYVYVNESTNVLETKKTLTTRTREYDIEMKDVWYIVKTTENGKTAYRKEKSSVPMLFIQTKYFDDFSDDIVKANKDKTTFTATPAADASAKTELVTNFESVYQAYETIKETVTFQAIVTYIGDADQFFDKQTDD